MISKANLGVLNSLINHLHADMHLHCEDESLDGTADDVKFAMTQLSRLFESANLVFNLLPNEVQEKILQFHIEGCSINHSLRWGEQAAQDILEDPSAVAIDSSN
jgi:hypothetical protein